MKYIFFFLSLVFISTSCNDELPPDKLSNMLKKTMNTYLYEQVNNDSSKVKYQIEEVIYFAEKKEYICDFKVKMIVPGKTDTTGLMRAYISKDFKEVKRTH